MEIRVRLYCFLLPIIIVAVWLHNESFQKDITGKPDVVTIREDFQCSDTNDVDIKCWTNTFPFEKIPTTLEAYEQTCRAFDSGLDCVTRWLNHCVNRINSAEIYSSLLTGLRTYRFICDVESELVKDLLRYGDCFWKVTRHWDTCARNFLHLVKAMEHNRANFCCFRDRFFHCVETVGKDICRDGEHFLRKLAHVTLLSRMWKSFALPHCAKLASEENCRTNSAVSSGAPRVNVTSSPFYTFTPVLTALVIFAFPL